MNEFMIMALTFEAICMGFYYFHNFFSLQEKKSSDDIAHSNSKPRWMVKEEGKTIQKSRRIREILTNIGFYTHSLIPQILTKRFSFSSSLIEKIRKLHLGEVWGGEMRWRLTIFKWQALRIDETFFSFQFRFHLKQRKINKLWNGDECWEIGSEKN